MRQAVVACVLIAVASVGCRTGYDRSVERLARDVPDDDRAWDAALNLARENGRLDEHCARLETIADANPDQWAPHWAAGECALAGAGPEAAARWFETAFGLARVDSPVGVAQAGDELAWIRFTSGEPETARTIYRETIEAARAAGRADLEAFSRNNLAGVLLDLGELSAARGELAAAEALLERLGMADAARGAAFNRGTILWELGDVREAGAVFERVLAASRAANDSWGVDACAGALGNLHLSTEEPLQAIAWFEQVGNTHPDRRVLADLGLGRARMQAGDYVRAGEHLEAAAAGATGVNELYGLLARSFHGEARWRAGETRAGVEQLEAVVTAADEREFAEPAWTARAVLGKIALDEGRIADARGLLERAVAILEQLGQGLDPLGEGMYLLRRRSDPYVDLAWAVADRPDAVLSTMTRAQARALRASIGDAGGTDVPTLRRGLRAGELLLQYLLGEDRGVLLAVSPERATVHALPGRRALVAGLRAYRDGLRSAAPAGDDAVRDSGRELRAALLGPVEHRLRGARRLLVVPDRELALIPFSALPDGDGFLGLRREVAVLPLAGAPLRDPGGSGATLLAGLPTRAAGSPFEELPWAAFELSNLKRLYPEPDTRYLDGDALTVDALAGELGRRWGTVHLAAHAVASTRDPQKCGVVLAQDERLGIDRIVDLALDDALVVLSACRTAEGELVPGEGVVGLTWAFLRAGAGAVVASQWSVNDEASARLMIEFHRARRAGDDVVAALAHARRELAATHPAPAYWAPFVVVLRPATLPDR